MKIRLEGTPEELQAAEAKLRLICSPTSVSKPYKNRNSELQRVYIEAELQTIETRFAGYTGDYKPSMEDIEDAADLAAYEAAMEEYRKNPVTYSHADVVQELGIDEPEAPSRPISELWQELEEDADLGSAAKTFVEFMEEDGEFSTAYARICNELERLSVASKSQDIGQEGIARMTELMRTMVFGQEIIVTSYMEESGFIKVGDGPNRFPRWEREDAQKILEGMNTPVEECIPESEVSWGTSEEPPKTRHQRIWHWYDFGVECLGGWDDYDEPMRRAFAAIEALPELPEDFEVDYVKLKDGVGVRVEFHNPSGGCDKELHEILWRLEEETLPIMVKQKEKQI